LWSMSTTPPTMPKAEKTGEHTCLGKWSNRLWAAGNDVPRAPHLYAAAHWRCRRCCRLTRLANGTILWQLPRFRLLRRRCLAWWWRRGRGVWRRVWLVGLAN
jgi:hypothetical protein